MATKLQVQDIIGLTPMQEGMLYDSLREGSERTYVEQLTVKLTGPLEPPHAEEAFRRLMARHDIFRTVYKISPSNKPVGIVLKERSVRLHTEDWSDLSPEELEDRAAEFKERDLSLGFRLDRDVPLRLAVLKTGQMSFEFLFTFHHIILDGWSLGIMLQEFLALYTGLCDGRSVELPPAQPFSRYVHWLENQDREQAGAYWAKLLEGYDTAAEWPNHGRTPSVREGYDKRVFEFAFSRELTQALQELALGASATLHALVQTLWGILLQRYSGTKDVVFGTVVHGRPAELPGMERAVGLFINTVPVRIRDLEQTLGEMAASVSRGTWDAKPYETYPLYEILAMSELKQGLFDHVIAFENMPVPENDVWEDSGLRVESMSMVEQTGYPLHLNIVPEEELRFQITYNAGVFESSVIEGIGRHLSELARQAAQRGPQQHISQMTLLSHQEEQELLHLSEMGEGSDYPEEATLTSLFEEQVRQHPEHTAVVFSGRQISYSELNVLANRISWRLKELGVGPEVRVALLLERSALMIAAMLGILKAGGAYVPVDPAHPEERAALMLRNSGAAVLLTDRSPSFAVGDAAVLFVDDPDLSACSRENPPASQGPAQLAYVLYTSGTTGTPKGVMVEHRQVVQLLKQKGLPLAFGPEDVWTVFHAYTFDFSVWEIFGALLSGGRCVVVPKQTAQNPAHFLELLERHEVTVLNQTPTAFAALIQEINDQARHPRLRLRYVIFGGEALQPRILLPWVEAYPETRLINMYGITETTVHVTLKEIGGHDLSAGRSLIGKPLPALRCRVLDEQRRLVPAGAAGELYVGGAGVTRGYAGREDLTRERYLADPFAPGERLYRTGDRVRLLPGGELEYLGRLDQQVKIRGHRIETGEIEHALLSHPDVAEAIVLPAAEEGGDALCAYVVLREGGGTSGLRRFLLDRLPDYMVPAYFIPLASMPRTATGKLDRRALPAPVSARSREAYVPPRDELEASLAAIWQEVLGVEEAGIRDSFFELGGHSLKAAALTAKLSRRLGRTVTLKQLFAGPTIEELAAVLRAEALAPETAGEPAPSMSIPAAPAAEHYPLTPAQRRMYLLNRLETEGTHYHITGAVELRGALEPERLKLALGRLMQRHEALRTSFGVRDGELCQTIHPDVSLEVERYTAEEEQMPGVLQAFVRPFDPGRAPLLRAALVRLPEQRQVLLLDVHHLISDAVSLQVMLSELSALYRGESLAPLPVQYKDYAVWLHGREGLEEDRQAEAFWLESMSGELPSRELPADRPRTLVQTFEGERLPVLLDPELHRLLRETERQTGTTTFMVLLAVYQILLAKYTGQEDIVVGTPVAGRSHDEVQHLIGLFMNTLAMRGRPVPSRTFSDYLDEVKSFALAAFEHGAYPLERLLEKLEIPRELGRNPLYDAMIIMQNAPKPYLELDGVAVRPYPLENRTAPLELILEAVETEEEHLRLTLQYNTALFHRETAERMLSHYIHLLRQALSDPQAAIGALELAGPLEKERLLSASLGRQDLPLSEEPVHARFEGQAELLGAKEAVIFRGSPVTYADLNRQANRWARVLAMRGVGRGSLVAVRMERSAGLLAALLAVLKSGAAYLPIDPAYPDEAVRRMLGHSGASLLLMDAAIQQPRSESGTESADGPGFAGSVLRASELEAQSAELDGTDLPVLSGSRDLAYVIYTSGSTGMPKGVMIEHGAVVHYIDALCADFSFDTCRRILSLTTVSFDIFVTESLAALACGMTVLLASGEEKDNPEHWARLIADHGADVLQTTPSRLRMLEQVSGGFRSLGGLKLLMVGGEAFPEGLLHELQRTLDARLLNVYGPSETTVWSTWHDVTGEDHPYIGRPLGRTRAYVLSPEGRLLPDGIPGELVLGGPGVARGYLHDPARTAERFVYDPWFPGERMYRTGDRVKRTANGTLQYLGRLDEQVKISGYRIEPGEVEAALNAYPPVEQAAVVCRTDRQGDLYLCAYVTGSLELDPAELRLHLAGLLPAYKVPSRFVQLPSLPLTPSGKINRKALPEPPEEELAGHLPPQTPAELRLAQLWSEVLGRGRIGAGDSFFELGGTSLKAARLIHSLQAGLDVHLPLRDIFRFPVLRDLARHVELQQKRTLEPILSAGGPGSYPMSSAQRRIYFMNELDPGAPVYHMPAYFLAEGALDVHRFRSALEELAGRHESLRTSFGIVEGKPVQRVHATAEVEIETYTAGDLEEAKELAERFIRPFDLGRAPLLRVGLVRITDRLHVVLTDMHHIISDGMSLEVLRAELASLYAGSPLPDLSAQYKDYAVWQSGQMEGEAYRELEAYWLEKFADGVPALNLGTDRTRPPQLSFEGDAVEFRAAPELYQRLTRLAGSSGTTMYMVLLAGFKLLLHKYTGQEELVVGSPAAARPHPQLQGVIGMFVNMLSLHTKPQADKTFRSYLQEVKQEVLDSEAHSGYPFETLVDRLQPERDLSRNPLFDVVFLHQNTSASTRLSGDLVIRSLPWQPSSAKFDWTLEALETGQELVFTLQYATRLFERTTAERAAVHLLRILQQVSLFPEIELGELYLLDEAEERQVLKAFNPEASVYPAGRTIHALFEEQAERQPERAALQLPDGPVTYGELNRQADGLAAVLRRRGMGPEQVVGVLTERNRDHFAATLAILKAGGAYLHLDPELPDERIRSLLQDSGAAAVFAPEAFRSRVGPGIPVIDPEAEALSEPLHEGVRTTGEEPAGSPRSLAYVMYTSGSTGKPKGVMVEHRSVLRLLFGTNYVEFREDDRLLLTGGIGFDATTFEIWGALLHGLTLHLCPKEILLDAERLKEEIEKQGITMMWLTSPLHDALLQMREDCFASLRWLIVGGDIVSPRQAEITLKHAPALKLVNGYGPTENTTFTTAYRIGRPSGEVIPIGRPLANSAVYILDSRLRPQPVGVPGELYAGGDGVARGYLNNEQLTAERFLPDPFAPGGRIYRTGDLAKWLPDGNIVFLGRADTQLKIRGYRIEPGEIEGKLLTHPAVRQALVTAYQEESGAAALCAYLVAGAGDPAGGPSGAPAESDALLHALKVDLAAGLPAYMVPEVLMLVDELPLTANGKVDRGRLPRPVREKEGSQAVPEAAAAGSDMEALLLRVWRDVLGRPGFGAQENFFEGGGDSIKGIQIAARLREHGLRLEIRDLFRYPAVTQLAPHIKPYKSVIPQEPVEGPVPFTPVQLWWLEQHPQLLHHFNQSMLLHSRDRLSAEPLDRALLRLAEHHDALRLRLEPDEEGILRQRNAGLHEAAVRFLVRDVREEASEAEAVLRYSEELQRSLDLHRGPLLAAGLFQASDGDHLLIAVHHLAVDGVSWRILLQDLFQGYEQAIRGEAILLPEKTTSFRTWAEELQAYARQQKLLRQADYWARVEAADCGPLFGSSGDMGSGEPGSRTVTVTWTSEETERLHAANRTYATDINDLLLAALGRTLCGWTGKEAVLLHLEGHGREEVLPSADVTRTIGWFTSIFPVVLRSRPDGSLGGHLIDTKEMLRSIPDKGFGYGVLKYLTPAELRPQLLCRVQPDVSFNYLGEFGQEAGAGRFGPSRFEGGAPADPAMRRAHTLDIIGASSQGCLQLDWVYNAGRIPEKDVKALAERYKRELLELARHCLEKEEAVATPSDVGLGLDLSMDELDEISLLVSTKLKR
ncbi:non-ribosomal peptide synthetase [Paenibacillus mucilaginosus]|uniref:Tyrocidine synthetase 2 n=1 Tax=Paenibacillus mucilaginosus (strain KNP414) TaxID=1036673 RepID=F8F990_PAEMK|nr:non-ribosomal peptide synthetase [Paenibacillus mucilaginosus]AEI43018.1 Tyrocidine synthetase 2 [Paenibacillus mucilaginosus KNP414]MCG7215961.1 non-ribosomal peptide synthetase [Paenibacillus mucilaginosus]WDM24646.1 non-ribosomal peptide synthetase [Paenibacillus mucilaginosus]